MEGYANEFEEAIANVPYSTEFFEMRNNVVHVIMDVYYSRMSYFRMIQSTPNDDPNRKRSLIFEIYGTFYMYNEHFENGLIESGQLDKIIYVSDGFEDCTSVVLYSNVVNAPPAAAMALKYYKLVGMYEINKQISKG